MKKILSILTIMLLCLPLFSGCADPAALTIDILKIGQADAIILKTPSHAVLIDTGEEDDSAEILQKLSDLEIRKLDLLLITHYDKDHIGGAPEILKSIEVKEIAEPGYEKDGKRYSAYRAAAEGIPCTIPTEPVCYQFGDLSLTVYPPRKSYENENDASLVTLAVCNGQRLLFTGDIMEERIGDLLADGTELSADFLKIPHHGKLEANSGDLLRAVSPEVCVITSSDKNPADRALLELLNDYGTAYETRNGDVRITVTAQGELLTGQ